jgi:hypothetical protein
MTAQIPGLRDVGEAFLADVAAHPGDVAPRLVYPATGAAPRGGAPPACPVSVSGAKEPQ